MVRKFRKKSTRVLKRKTSRPKGRRRTQSLRGAVGGGSAAKAGGGRVPDLTKPQKRRYQRGTLRKTRIISAPAAEPSTIKYSPGLSIGTYKAPTFAQKVLAITRSPQHMVSKWTFQMDCISGRVSAAQIPILTQNLIDVIAAQFQTSPNMLSDTGFAPGTMTSTAPFNNQYQFQISSYTSKLRLYNSSTNTLRARIVWYKPVRDLDNNYEGFGANTTDPLNYLMIASNSAGETGGTLSPGNGTWFDNATAGSNYTANYNHAGWPVVGAATTTSSTANVVAHLDTSLVPGSPQVKRMFSANWRTVKEEDFTLQPGSQYNTSVTLKNRIIHNLYDDIDVYHRKSSTVIGVVYVIGQMVFDDRAANSTISTGSSQLSVMREDSCTVLPTIIKRTVRVNLTSQYQVIADANQGIVNIETNDVDDTFATEL